MKYSFKTFTNRFAKEIKSHPLTYILLIVILSLAFFIRVYRLNDLLGFYYDQGRDALVIWDLWYKGNFFLVGPTTGLAGIFRGPWYYWLVAPLYLVGKGNPLWPAIFLALTSVIAIWLSFLIASRIQNKTAGIIAAIVASFSYSIVIASRWLSNPTPMLLLSLILVWGMLKVSEGKKWGWPLISFVVGLSLFNFGSSGELYYLLAIILFIIWQWKNRPDTRNLILSLVLFGITFFPLVIFDLRHDGILRQNMYQSFIQEKSFTLPTKYLLENRTEFYYDVFSLEIFHFRGKRELLTLGAIAISFLFFLPNLIKKDGMKILLLFMVSPMIGLYFYQGNYKVLYDYYMTGYYLIFILVVACVIGYLSKYALGKIFALLFVFLFLTNNFEVLKIKLSDKLDGPNSIALLNEKKAVTWVFEDADGRNFNVDVYVPPVIPYAYDYLFLWQGTLRQAQGKQGCEKELCGMKQDERIFLLYTLYEQDPPHPERLEAWLARQKGIGKIEEEVSFGGITVQRRSRL